MDNKGLTMMRVGFIGLGIMGQPMCRNLMKAGYPMTVFARRADVREAFRQEGASIAETISACADGVDVLITMLPNAPEVREVLLGEKIEMSGDTVADSGSEGEKAELAAAIDTLKAGATVIDMSSINPLESQAISQVLAGRSINFLDAPVSGGEPKAIAASLSIMVGGDEAVFERHYDLLKVMAATVVRVGDIGAGNTAKLANNMIVAVNIAAVAEALVFAEKAGVDPLKVYEAIRAGLAGSNVLDAKAQMMVDHHFEPGFRVNLHQKDLRNAQAVAESKQIGMPFAEKAKEILDYLVDSGYGIEDHSSMLRYFERED